jgi:hypothetical protein
MKVKRMHKLALMIALTATAYSADFDENRELVRERNLRKMQQSQQKALSLSRIIEDSIDRENNQGRKGFDCPDLNDELILSVDDAPMPSRDKPLPTVIKKSFSHLLASFRKKRPLNKVMAHF